MHPPPLLARVAPALLTDLSPLSYLILFLLENRISTASDGLSERLSARVSVLDCNYIRLSDFEVVFRFASLRFHEPTLRRESDRVLLLDLDDALELDVAELRGRDGVLDAVRVADPLEVPVAVRGAQLDLDGAALLRVEVADELDAELLVLLLRLEHDLERAQPVPLRVRAHLEELDRAAADEVLDKRPVGPLCAAPQLLQLSVAPREPLVLLSELLLLGAQDHDVLPLLEVLRAQRQDLAPPELLELPVQVLLHLRQAEVGPDPPEQPLAPLRDFLRNSARRRARRLALLILLLELGHEPLQLLAVRLAQQRRRVVAAQHLLRVEDVREVLHDAAVLPELPGLICGALLRGPVELRRFDGARVLRRLARCVLVSLRCAGARAARQRGERGLVRAPLGRLPALLGGQVPELCA